MKISEAFAEYERSEILAVNCSNNTLQGYIYAAKSAIGYFGDIEITSLTLEMVQKYYMDLRVNHAANTARGYVVSLRAVLRLCRRRGLDVIDAEDIKIPKRDKVAVGYLTKEEIERFADIAGQSKRGYPAANRLRNVLIIKMLFVTGLRISELVALNRDSIRDKQFCVVGKSKDPRPCFITDEIEKLIEEYLATRTDNNRALFVSSQTGGKRISAGTVRNMFRRICDQSEFSAVHPHTLRHSYGTYMLSMGVDIRDVSTLMGHQSLETTRIYTHVTDKRLKDIHTKVMA